MGNNQVKEKSCVQKPNFDAPRKNHLQECKIAIFGSKSSGKTSLTTQFIMNRCDNE